MSTMLVFIYIQQGRKTQLLHVFQEDFILNNLEKKRLGKETECYLMQVKNFLCNEL